jgi:hypothetical protein
MEDNSLQDASEEMEVIRDTSKALMEQLLEVVAEVGDGVSDGREGMSSLLCI